MKRAVFLVRLLLLLVVVAASACKAGGCVANSLGDVVGATGDVACDRRFGTEPAPFCQEVIDTVAVSEVKDDCKQKFSAQTYEDKCPRQRIIGGCKLHTNNDDGSEVWDWYYDVSDFEDAAARDAAGRDAATDGPVFKDPVASKDAVKKLCADKTRYDQGATYADP